MSDTRSTPRCIGIILDGNRRWAKEQGLPAFEGHRRGLNNIENIVYAARDQGIRHVVVFAFSTENWKRTEEEVSYLMQLFESVARERFIEFLKENIAVRFIGQKERMPATLRDIMNEIEEKAPTAPHLTLWICISYGGKADIVQAALSAARTDTPLSEESLEAHLWTAGMPDPDLIIRTSGEKRLSNFLLWQSAYSELFFTDTFWPAFTPAHLEDVLKAYAKRERRIGA